jgi:hypothetical protein
MRQCDAEKRGLPGYKMEMKRKRHCLRSLNCQKIFSTLSLSGKSSKKFSQ